MTVYHGSPAVVEQPLLSLCRPRNDYGRAFYCTFDVDLAREWACGGVLAGGYVNAYAFNPEGLKALDLDADPDGVLAWIAVLLDHRTLDREWNMRHEVERFVAAHAVDLTGYDVVEGYRADDSYFAIARAFASGSITDIQLARALKLGQLGRQIAFRTPRGIDALTFVEAQRVDPSIWGARRVRRDRRARRAFADMRCEPEAPGRRIYELGGDGA